MLLSCTKEEGRGGSGSIHGSITELYFDEDFSRQLHQEAAVDEEVFILFGNEAFPGDRVNTGPDGEFRFTFLYPGSYSIYFRSDDSTQVPDDGWSQLIEVSLAKGQDKNLGQLVKLNTLEFDEGQALIHGKVRRIKYDKDSYYPNLVVEYVDWAHEHEVYLSYNGRTGYDERVRTAHDGSFAFRNLLPGTYTVFLYSEDVSKLTQHVVISFDLEITAWDEVIDLGQIDIEAH